jgi:hypothetical protein
MASLRKAAAILVTWSTIVAFVTLMKHITAFTPPLHPMHHGRRQSRTIPFDASTALNLSSSDIQAKLKAQMAKLQERDRSSREISSNVGIYKTEISRCHSKSYVSVVLTRTFS